MGFALHRRRAEGRAQVSQPVRRFDVRVGSSTNGLAPVSSASRSLAAGVTQWLALGAIAFAAIAADQLTKHIVTSRLSLDEGTHVVGPFWIHHVQNSGIAFGLFASATAVVIVLHVLRALRRPPSNPAAGPRARDRRQPLEPARPRPARICDRLPRPAVLAGVQPRRQLHRGRRPLAARRTDARGARAAPAPARA